MAADDRSFGDAQVISPTGSTPAARNEPGAELAADAGGRGILPPADLHLDGHHGQTEADFACRQCGQPTTLKRVVRSGDLRFDLRVCPDSHQSDFDAPPPTGTDPGERAVIYCTCGHPAGSHFDGMCATLGCRCRTLTPKEATA